MLDRYSRPAMKKLWTPEARYEAWARVERAHLVASVKRGWAPASVLADFDQSVASTTSADYLAKEQETHHDVIAFVAVIGEAMGIHSSCHLHKGLTSSDIVDTALALNITDSLKILISSVDVLLAHLGQRAFEHMDTLCIGRTHGIHAEPVSFGQLLAGHFATFSRAREELFIALQKAAFGKLSGAVGAYSQLDPSFEEDVLSSLNLTPEPAATQVMSRDRIVIVGRAVVAVANAIERFAVNLRHWSRTEVGEVSEPFARKQKGSSAMPHKKNPILAENLCGLARVIRGLASMLDENVALWHERDMSHSSVERMALPDIFVTADFMIHRCANLIANMEIYPQVMMKNLKMTGGLWASQTVLTTLVERGMDRTKAYEIVQKIAMDIHHSHKASSTFEASDPNSCPFLEALSQESSITAVIPFHELPSLFQTDRFLKWTPLIFRRVFGDKKPAPPSS